MALISIKPSFTDRSFLHFRLFTTMVGHKSSLVPIKAFLKEAGACSWNETEFCQGRTTRWGLAWTFCDNIVLANPPLSRRKNNVKGPPPLNYSISREQWSSKGEFSVACVLLKSVELLNSLKVRPSLECKTFYRNL